MLIYVLGSALHSQGAGGVAVKISVPALGPFPVSDEQTVKGCMGLLGKWCARWYNCVHGVVILLVQLCAWGSDTVGTTVCMG
jgi:hypothetical protein